MYRCAFIGEDEQQFLVLSDDIDAIEEAMDALSEAYQNLETENMEGYVAHYREAMGIPLDATIDEEREIVQEKYGVQPVKNEDFIKLMRQLEETYEQCKEEVNWREFFEEMGFETRDITHYIVIGKGR